MPISPSPPSLSNVAVRLSVPSPFFAVDEVMATPSQKCKTALIIGLHIK